MGGGSVESLGDAVEVTADANRPYFESMRRLSYANVMSTVAVFIALGGGAVAATSLSSTPGVLTLCVGRTGSVKVLTGKRCAKETKSVAVNERGIQGAPVLFVNKERVDGLQRKQFYTAILDQELKDAPAVQASLKP